MPRLFSAPTPANVEAFKSPLIFNGINLPLITADSIKTLNKMQILTCCLQNGEANGDEEGESKEGVIEQEVRTSRPLKQRVNPHLKLYVLHNSGLIFSSFYVLVSGDENPHLRALGS